MHYYLNYIEWFSSLPNYGNVLFLDEVHFDGQEYENVFFFLIQTNYFLELQSRNLIWTPIGEKNNNSTSSYSSLNENYTMTTIICPSRNIYFDIRKNSNSADDFVGFILAALVDGYLRPGDILILDNATVHSGSDLFPQLVALLNEAHVDLRFLPTYSPELSPVELVFNMIKTHIRYRRTQRTLLDAILDATSNVTSEKVTSSYAHVLHEFVARIQIPPV